MVPPPRSSLLAPLFLSPPGISFQHPIYIKKPPSLPPLPLGPFMCLFERAPQRRGSGAGQAASQAAGPSQKPPALSPPPLFPAAVKRPPPAHVSLSVRPAAGVRPQNSRRGRGRRRRAAPRRRRRRRPSVRALSSRSPTAWVDRRRSSPRPPLIFPSQVCRLTTQQQQQQQQQQQNHHPGKPSCAAPLLFCSSRKTYMYVLCKKEAPPQTTTHHNRQQQNK